MQKKEFSISGKRIEVYDDVFTAKERLTFYNYAYNAQYSVTRVSHDLPEHRKYQKTLKANLPLSDMVTLGFFENSFLLNYIKENKLRVRRCYINLCTASDNYAYHIDDEDWTSRDVLTGLYYLNLDWDPTWEGETHFSDESMKDILFTSSFIPGRLVLFDGSIPHKSSQPGPMATNYRFVLAIKFSNETEPRSWHHSVNIEDFYYDRNISLSPTEEKAIQFIKDRTVQLSHSHGSFYDHLFNTFCLLKSYGLSDEVCLAGLFHSIYGTEFYHPQLTINETEVKSLIGEYANRLVKCFSEQHRFEKIMSNYFNLAPQDDLNLTYILYANEVEQAARIPMTDLSPFATIKNKIDHLKETHNGN